jgi:CRP-like cAMP-binding protein
MLSGVQRTTTDLARLSEPAEVQIEDLAALALFEGLSREQLAKLAPLFRRVSLTAGQSVFAAGDSAREMYVIESGEVCLWINPDDGGCLEIGRIRPSGMLGRSAMLGRPAYSASAECVTDTRLLAVRGRAVRRILRADPALGHLLLERLARIGNNRSTGWHAQLMKLFRR